MLSQLALLGVLIACSLFISGSETALFALTARQLRAFAKSDSPLKRRAQLLMRHPQRVLMTVLLANTTINVGIFAVSFAGAARSGSANPLTAAISGVIALVLVLLCGEVIPKAIALAHAATVAPIAAPIVHILQVVTTPIRAVLHIALVEPITRLLSPADSRNTVASADDLRSLVEMSADQGVISSRENDMLQAVFVLPEILVRSVMVPRVAVKAIKHNSPRAMILRTFHETRLKQLPVFGRDMDDLQGVLRMRDLYLQPNRPIVRLIRPIRFVPEVINLLQLIHHFRQTQTRYAIVVDEHGGVSGLVTLEDVVEQIVGELASPGRLDDDAPITKLDPFTYVASGRLSVRHWRKALGNLPQLADVDTIGGVVAALLGRLPRVGDHVRVGEITLTVEQMAGRRIDRVRLRLGRDNSGDAA